MEKIVELLKQLSEEVAKTNSRYVVELDITVNCSEKAFESVYHELRKQYSIKNEDTEKGYTPIYVNLRMEHNRAFDDKQKSLSGSILKDIQ